MSDYQNKLINQIINNYQFVEKIGSGSFGAVYKAIHLPTSLIVSIKTMEIDIIDSDESKIKLLSEVNILRSLHHPFIAEFFDFFETDHHFYIVMEYCPNGSLYDFLLKYKKLDEGTAMRIFHQLISSLEYLHFTKHIVHRDLKSRNIMFDHKYNIKLIDFGLSKQFQTQDANFLTHCGTPAYMPPEIIQNNPYNTECDIWSLAVILYEMLMGKRPFSDKNRNILFKRILTEEPIYNGLSDELTSLLSGMLKKNPAERYNLKKTSVSCCLHEIKYQTLMKETLTNIMGKDDTDYVDSFLVGDISEENKAISIHILAKEKITGLIGCLNPIDFELLDNLLADENLKNSEKGTKLVQAPFPRRMSDPKISKQVPISQSPQGESKPEGKNPLINQKRRKSIQQIITNAQHAPISDTAYTKTMTE